MPQSSVGDLGVVEVKLLQTPHSLQVQKAGVGHLVGQTKLFQARQAIQVLEQIVGNLRIGCVKRGQAGQALQSFKESVSRPCVRAFT